jgi:hypothetical protein
MDQLTRAMDRWKEIEQDAEEKWKPQALLYLSSTGLLPMV